MPENTDTLRSRLRLARKVAGLSQRDLAAAADLSVSLIQKVEQGERTEIRLETAHALARALGTTTSHLIPPESSPHWQPPGSSTVWRAVVAALDAVPAQPPEPSSIDGVKGALAGGRALFATEQYDSLGRLLPALIRDVSALDDTPDSRRLRYQVMSLCVSYLGQVRQSAAAADAAQRALDAATDELDGAAAAVARALELLRQGRLSEAAELATRWADDIEPRISRARPEELAVWGGLQLRIGAASVRDNRSAEAKTALRMAQIAAVALGQEIISGPDHLRHFGPATVTQQRAEHAAIQRRPDRVLRLHKAVRQWTPAAGGGRSGRYRHLLDVADAHLRLRNEGQCVATLKGIRQAAPEWLDAQRYAHDIMGRVVERRRTLTPEMRELADSMGILV